MISSVAYNGHSVIVVGQSFVSLSVWLVQSVCSVCMVKRSLLVSMINSIAYYDLSVDMSGQCLESMVSMVSWSVVSTVCQSWLV